MPTTSAAWAGHPDGGYRPSADVESALVAAGHDLEAIATIVRRALGDRDDLAVYLAVAEFGGEHLRMAAWCLPPGVVDGPPPDGLITVAATRLGKAFAAGGPFEVEPDPDLIAGLQGRFRRLVDAHPVRHVYAVPIVATGSRPVGMLGVSTVRERPSADDRAALATLAARIAVPVAHARLLPAVERATRRQESLAALAQAAFTTTSPHVLYELVSRTMLDALGASTAGVLEFDRDGSAVLRAASGIDRERVDRFRIAADDPFLATVLGAGRTVRLVDGDASSSAERPGPHKVLGIGSSLCAVVRRDGDPVAVIGVGRADPLLFGADDLAFVDSVASITANALEMHATHPRLRHQADTDELTGLPNRSLMTALIDDAAVAAGRDGLPLALLLADLDGFKVLNDSLGHAAGDEVLRVVADRLAVALGNDGLLGRLGGDEFAALLPATGADEALAMADRLLGALAEPVRVAGTEITVRASVGVTVLAPASDARGRSVTARAAELLPQADLAMYRAKASNRQRVIMFDHGMHDEVQQRLAIEEGLRAAIGTDQLTLHYQPLVAPHKGGRITSLEALLRWTHPTLGPIPPDRFIAIAEESDLIHQLSHHVIDVAARQVAAWDAAGLLDDRYVAINLSARDLMDPGIVERIQRVLADTGCDPFKLGVEVTETLLTDESGVAALRALRGLGMHIALDDYGTGYSSVGQIRTMPFHALKIDRSFISAMHLPADRVIVELTILMAHVLGLRVVAEGVETLKQLEDLMSQGCDFVQGYLLARPQPADTITGYLADGLPEIPAILLERADPT